MSLTTWRPKVSGNPPFPTYKAALTHEIDDSLAFTRATAATVVDHEGLIKTCKSNEVRLEGARRVENLFTYSEDMSDTIWIVAGSGSPTKSVVDGEDRITWSSGVGNLYQIAPGEIAPGKTFIVSWKVRLISDGGDNRWQISIRDNPSTDVGSSAVIALPVGVEKIFTYQHTFGSSPNVDLYAQLRYTGAGSPEIAVLEVQMEEATGQTNQNPSEYVSTDVGTGSEGVVNYSFDTDSDWTKGTGWTITGGQAVHTSPTGGTLKQTITTIPGRTYILRIDVVSNTDSYTIRWEGGAIAYPTAPGSYTYSVVASGVTATVEVYDDKDMAVNSFSAKLADHGAGVDGVKYFNTENGNTVSTHIMTEATGSAIAESTLKGYLCEEIATNLMIYSEDFSQLGGFREILTASAEKGPDGRESMTNFEASETNANGSAITQNVDISIGTYAMSCYAKNNTSDMVCFRPTNSGDFNSRVQVFFDLNAGVVTSTGEVGTEYSYISSSITDVGNGISRCELVFSILDDTNITLTSPRMYLVDNNNSLSVTIGSSIYIFGFQLEESSGVSAATSYIKTTGTEVTRNSDELIYPTGASIGDFAIKLEVTPKVDYTDYSSGGYRIFGSNDASATAGEFRASAPGTNWAYTPTTGGGYQNIHNTSIVKDTLAKVGFSIYQDGANSIASVAHDGSLKNSESNAQTLDHSDISIEIGHWSHASDFANGNYKNIKLFIDKKVKAGKITSLTS